MVQTENQEVQEIRTPIFQEVNQINEETAISILIQAAQMAQKSGALGIRDSVLLAKAIDILRPGVI